LPAEIDGDNRIPLQTQNPLGHGIAFRFLPATSHLGIQYDPRVLSPGRFVQYVGAMLENAIFDLESIVRDDMWDQFRLAAVRKVSIAVASPAKIERVDRGAAASAVSSFKSMAEAYEAPKIMIEMSMGTKKGSLGEAIKAVVQYFRRSMIDGENDVTKLKARIKADDGRPEDIDLLQDILSVRQVLELNDNNPDFNYKVKLRALQEAMNAWIK